MPPFKGGERSLPSKCLRPDFYSNSGHVCLVIPPPHPPNEQKLGEMTVSSYDFNENADYEFGEMTLSNCNSNESADCELGEMTLSNYDSNKNANYELGEMTLSNYNYYENADCNCGERTLSNCDSNGSANCEPGESEDSDGPTHPDVTSVIGPVPMHIPNEILLS